MTRPLSSNRQLTLFHRLRRTAAVALFCAATVVGNSRTAGAQKSAGGKGTGARVAVDRRSAIASDASIRFGGAISSLRIVGWDRDSLVITGTVPAGWRFDGGVAAGTLGGPGRGAKFFIEAPSDVYPNGAALEVRVPTSARVWAHGRPETLPSSTRVFEVASTSGPLT